MPKKQRLSTKLIQLVSTVFRCTAYDMNSEETYVHVSMIEDSDGRVYFPTISLREIRVLQQKVREVYQFDSMDTIKGSYANKGYIQDLIVKSRLTYSENIIKDVLESAQVGLFNFYLSNLIKRLKDSSLSSKVVFYEMNKIILECPKEEFARMKKFVGSGLDIFDMTIGEYTHMLSYKKIKNLGEK